MDNEDVADCDDDVAVKDNQENWDDRAEVHFASGYGDLDAFVADPDAITSVARRDLAVLKPYLPGLGKRVLLGSSTALDSFGYTGDDDDNDDDDAASMGVAKPLSELRLLHLQCHIGTDTISWARLGARDVCGLDFSEKSLEHARDLAARAGENIDYVKADARYASATLPKRTFDVIVTSAGTVTWLPKLDEWARSIAELLAPGGIFMIRDNHPLLFALDQDETDGSLKIAMDYCSGAEDSYDTNETYTMAAPDESSDANSNGAAAGSAVVAGDISGGGAAGVANNADMVANDVCSDAVNGIETEDGIHGAKENGSKGAVGNGGVSSGHVASPAITHIHNHNWAHDFQEMIGVLRAAGLEIETVQELQETDWQSIPMLEYSKERDSWHMPAGAPRIPLTFAIVARKPVA